MNHSLAKVGNERETLYSFVPGNDLSSYTGEEKPFDETWRRMTCQDNPLPLEIRGFRPGGAFRS